jgi:alpha-ketoglutarate-dependent taurine dioxygenase
MLFRGFDVSSKGKFECWLRAVCPQLMRYTEGATPRTELGDKIYTSTEYPHDQVIALHNELTYVKPWPMKIAFFCEQPAERKGETPVADVRTVHHLIAPVVREKFERKGWMLVRNFGDGLSLPWQETFHTSNRADVEDYCKRALIATEWKSRDRLRTRQVRAAIRRHPANGEKVWFNHVAFWHISSLEKHVREALQRVFTEEDLPYNTYYGDGEEIETGVVEHITEAYRKQTIEFRWQKGDILLLDNMLVAHGRNSYEGERKVLVGMGEPYEGGEILR